MSHRERRGSDVFDEEPMQMPWPDPDFSGEFIDRHAIERAIMDEAQRATNYGRCAEPCRCARRSLRPASQARTKACLSGACRGFEVNDIRAFRARRGTDRAAVDARRFDGDEELAIETAITADACAVQRFAAESGYVLHTGTIRRSTGAELAVFGRRQEGFRTEYTESTGFRTESRISTGDTGFTGKEVTNDSLRILPVVGSL